MSAAGGRFAEKRGQMRRMRQMRFGREDQERQERMGDTKGKQKSRNGGKEEANEV